MLIVKVPVLIEHQPPIAAIGADPEQLAELGVNPWGPDSV